MNRDGLETVVVVDRRAIQRPRHGYRRARSGVDQHQRSPANHADAARISGRGLWRVPQARLTHGIRGILWHQGENDQGADGPTGGFGWETYQQYFVAMAAAWKEDYPNLEHFNIFQIWPKACAMGVGGSDNLLREVQRTLPALFSNLSIMSTLGIKPPGGMPLPAGGLGGIRAFDSAGHLERRARR